MDNQASENGWGRWRSKSKVTTNIKSLFKIGAKRVLNTKKSWR